MPKPQLYVTLKQKIRVAPEQHTFIQEYRTRRHISESQAIRDIIEHAMTCPFFTSNGIANGNHSTTIGELLP